MSKIEKKFKYDIFIDESISNLKLKKKVSKKNKLNLASNELLHYKINLLNDNSISHINLNNINSYEYYPDRIVEFSQLLNCEKEKITFFAGSDDAIKVIMSSITRRCGNMIIQTPNYENYYSYAKLYGINIVDWTFEDNYCFDCEEGIKILRNMKPSVVVITNPNGFTGKSLKYFEIKKILDICMIKSHILIIDCAYSEFDTIDYTILLKEYSNLILINTLSKSYGLAGGRFGYVISSKEIIKYLQYYNGINAISSMTYEIARIYLNNLDLFKEIVNDILENRREFIKFLKNSTSWKIFESNSNFVLIKLKSINESEDLERHLKKMILLLEI